MKTVFDKEFRYSPSHDTDIRRRFRQVNPGWYKKPDAIKPSSKVIQMSDKKKSA